VATKGQIKLLETEFQTARPPNPVFCHQEFLEKLAEHGRDAIGRRTAFLLQRLSFDAQRVHYKTTQGVNRGWRRSRLGGNQGSHFYAWWAPKNALPLKESGWFSEVPQARPSKSSDEEEVHGSQEVQRAEESRLVRRLRRPETPRRIMTA
jgi:hypothetical protein